MSTATATHPTERFASQTHMGTLELLVRDMDTMLDFYTEGVGLVPMSHENGTVILGMPDPMRESLREVVRLSEARDLRPAGPGQAGLFHTAIVFQDKVMLSRALLAMFARYSQLFTGTGDHWVSQAFYFSDPEGNGVELYWDRPRDQWRWVNGTVQMGTDWIDPAQFMRDALIGQEPESSEPPVGELGHVHLQVGDVATARDFYVDALGFDQTATLGRSALFVSAVGTRMSTTPRPRVFTRLPAPREFHTFMAM